MDSSWLNQWSSFVSNIDEETVAYMPGPVSSSKLHDTDGNILPNLRVKIDYRGVPPTVYYIFVKLYGRDRSPEITRYLVDIYGIPVEIPLLVKIQYRSQVRLVQHPT